MLKVIQLTKTGGEFMRETRDLKSIGLTVVFFLLLGLNSAMPQDAQDELLLQGIELSRQGKYDEAIGFYNKVLELNPKNVQALNNRATAHGFKAEFDSAIADYTKAIEIDPTFAV